MKNAEPNRCRELGQICRGNEPVIDDLAVRTCECAGCRRSGTGRDGGLRQCLRQPGIDSPAAPQAEKPVSRYQHRRIKAVSHQAGHCGLSRSWRTSHDEQLTHAATRAVAVVTITASQVALPAKQPHPAPQPPAARQVT
jgi:hypothetical protein